MKKIKDMTWSTFIQRKNFLFMGVNFRAEDHISFNFYLFRIGLFVDVYLFLFKTRSTLNQNSLMII